MEASNKTIEKNIKIWGQEIPLNLLNNDEIIYLEKYTNNEILTLEELWYEIDKIWDKFKLDNTKPFKGQKISDFYSHPIWILNGIYSSSDSLSTYHRQSIANYISNRENNILICDFGGGFGELSIQISKTLTHDKTINIVEPFPSKVGKHRISKYPQIIFTENLLDNYDIVIAQDVLEHVENPIEISINLVKSLKIGGQIIFANCFFPFIKAHLPKNFYLSLYFTWIMMCLGLTFKQNLEGSPHIQIFEKNGKINYTSLKFKILIAKILWQLRKVKIFFK